MIQNGVCFMRAKNSKFDLKDLKLSSYKLYVFKLDSCITLNCVQCSCTLILIQLQTTEKLLRKSMSFLPRERLRDNWRWKFRRTYQNNFHSSTFAKMNFKIHLCKSMQGYCKIVKVKKFVKSRSIYMLKTFRSQLDL